MGWKRPPASVTRMRSPVPNGADAGVEFCQQFVVENRGGAGGVVGADLVAKAKPDGYTIVIGSASITISPSLYTKMNYDPVKDLAPISLVGTVPNVLISHPSLPAQTLADFIALAKARPGAMSYASSGPGTPYHMAGELFKAMSETNIVHVPHKASGEARNSVLVVMVRPRASTRSARRAWASTSAASARAPGATRSGARTGATATSAAASARSPGAPEGRWCSTARRSRSRKDNFSWIESRQVRTSSECRGRTEGRRYRLPPSPAGFPRSMLRSGRKGSARWWLRTWAAKLS